MPNPSLPDIDLLSARAETGRFCRTVEAALAGVVLSAGLLHATYVQADNNNGADHRSGITTEASGPPGDTARYGRVIIDYAQIAGSQEVGPHARNAMPAVTQGALSMMNQITQGSFVRPGAPVLSGSYVLGPEVGSLQDVCDEEKLQELGDKVSDAIETKANVQDDDLLIVVLDRSDTFSCDPKTNDTGPVALHAQKGRVIVFDPKRAESGVLAHELNHDYYGHDNSLSCHEPDGVVVVDDACRSIEYGNGTTIAGAGAYEERAVGDPDPVTAFEQLFIGTIDSAQVAIAVLPSETFTINSVASHTAGIKAVRIPLQCNGGLTLNNTDGTSQVLGKPAIYLELSSESPKGGERPLSLKVYLTDDAALDGGPWHKPATYELGLNSDPSVNGLLAKDANRQVRLQVCSQQLTLRLDQLHQAAESGAGSAQVTVGIQ